MPAAAPTTVLAPHAVLNPPGADRGRRAAVLREGGNSLDAPLTALGADVGSEQVLELGALANRHAPELQAFDRWGRRVDEVRFHPAYHELMARAMRHGIHDVAWRMPGPGGHVAHAAMLALFTQAEAGVMCPVNMTYASVPALRSGGAPEWAGMVLGGQYDAPLRPAGEKRGITVGMAMTEKQGGSDVRANTTRAEQAEDGWRLVGHKWFCSAPMSDAFLTLAHTGRGLSCFLVPRITPDGRRNAIQLQRLKDKLGNRSNASAEIEYHGAHATLLGEQGRGVQAIIAMVHHTRLGTVAATSGIMAMALAQAAHHAAGRRAFGRTLADHAAMAGVVADLALEYEAAVLLLARVARAFDPVEAGGEPAFARLGVAVAKYWLTSRCPAFVFAAMECHGGAGYVEDGPMPRLFRESPLNAIWEGSGNVIALDILRTLARERGAGDALARELRRARGGHAVLDVAVDRLLAELMGTPPGEAEAREVAERMALALQGALMVRHAPAFVADAFIRGRLGGEGGRSFGALPRGADAGLVVARYRGA